MSLFFSYSLMLTLNRLQIFYFAAYYNIKLVVYCFESRYSAMIRAALSTFSAQGRLR